MQNDFLASLPEVLCQPSRVKDLPILLDEVEVVDILSRVAD